MLELLIWFLLENPKSFPTNASMMSYLVFKRIDTLGIGIQVVCLVVPIWLCAQKLGTVP